jgi:hypothetical protein
VTPHGTSRASSTYTSGACMIGLAIPPALIACVNEVIE